MAFISKTVATELSSYYMPGTTGRFIWETHDRSYNVELDAATFALGRCVQNSFLQKPLRLGLFSFMSIIFCLRQMGKTEAVFLNSEVSIWIYFFLAGSCFLRKHQDVPSYQPPYPYLWPLMSCNKRSLCTRWKEPSPLFQRCFPFCKLAPVHHLTWCHFWDGPDPNHRKDTSASNCSRSW